MNHKKSSENSGDAVPALDLAVLQDGIQRLQVGISICDAGLSLVTCNRRYQEIFGLPKALVQPGVALGEVMLFLAEHGEFGAGQKELLVQNALEPLQNLSAPLTFERRRPNGVYIETTAIPLEGGGYIATHTDISALKEREEDLRRSRMAMEVRMLERSEELRQRKAMEVELAEKTSWFKAAIDNIPGGMVLSNKDLSYYLWTKDVHRMWDLPPDMLQVGLPYQDVLRFFAERGDFGPGNIDDLVEAQIKPLLARQSIHIERHLASGTILDVRRNPLPNGGYVSIFQDITEKKRMEAEYAARTELMQAAIDHMPGGMVILDGEFRFALWSQGIESLLELPSGLLQQGLLYADLLQFFAERGDFGSGEIAAQVSARMQALQAGQVIVEEHRTPGGICLAIRRNPMPNGGYVCVYELSSLT